MSFRYPYPDNEKSFEKFCLKFLRRHWNNPQLQLYGQRGEEQLGVDIVDPLWSSPFRAGQCKHHEPHITIPPSEIQEEVDKALKFTPSLEQYTILTTGRVTTHGQNKIIEVNKDHRTKGLFSIEVLSWAQIEDYLDDYPELIGLLATVTNSQVQELSATVTVGLDRIGLQIESVTRSVSQTSFDSEIDEAESHLKGYDPQRAQMTLERISRRHWDSLTDQQKFRIKCVFSNCYLAQGEDNKAGRILLEAKGLYPDSDKAQIGEAVGYELIGELALAHETAIKLLTSNPHSTKLVSCIIRTAPKSKPFDDVKNFASPVVSGDSEVNLALALRAIQERRYDEAESFSRVSEAANPDWVGPKLLVGQAIISVESKKFQHALGEESTPLNRDRLTEAALILSEAINLGKRHKLNGTISNAYLFRAMANVFNQNQDAADQDFEEALKYNPGNVSAYRNQSHYLFSNNRVSECIVQLRKAGHLLTPAELFFLANVLSERGQEGDNESALNIYVNIALGQNLSQFASSMDDSEDIHLLRVAAFHSAIEEYIEAKKIVEASSFLGSVPSDIASDLSILTARSSIALARGDVSEATLLVEEALQQVSEGSVRHDLRGLALQLGKLERHKDAFHLWIKVTENQSYGADFRHLVTSAERIKRYDSVLKIAEAARISGIEDDWLFYKEITILENFDVNHAVELLQKRIQTHPEDKRPKFLLSQLGIKWARPELIEARLEELPRPEEVTAGGGEVVVEILRHGGYRLEAVKYAYELVRLYFNEPAANASLIRAFMAPSTKPVVIPDSLVVAPGTAVRYTEEGRSEQWIIIEDSPSPKHEYSEYSLDHSLCKALLNHKVGDVVSISKSSGRDRIAKIDEIISKYVFRLNNIMVNWQLRFPDEPFIQVFRCTTTDPNTGEEVPDFTDMQLVADTRFSNSQEAEAAYCSAPTPIHLFGEWIGTGPYSAFLAALSRPNLPVRSNRGQADEISKAREVFAHSHTMVLDLFALAMLVLTESTSILRNWKGNLIISQSTFTELKDALSRNELDTKTSGSFGKSRAGYHFVPTSTDLVLEEFAKFSLCVGEINNTCQVRGCPELADLEPDFREQLIGVFGQHGLESMILARSPGHVLWTEDQTLSDIASSEFAVRRVWTQIVFDHAAEFGFVTTDNYLTFSAKLLGLDIQTTSFTPFILIKSGTLSGWNPDRWPFNKALENFSHTGVATDQAFISAASMIVSMYRDNVIIDIRRRSIVAILDRLSKRRHGLAIARRLIAMFPRLFGLNVVGEIDASKIAGSWLEAASQRPRFGQIY